MKSLEVDEEEPEHENVGQVALDILDMDEELIIIAPLAGMAVEEVDLSISRNILTISGERQKPELYHRVSRVLVEECFYGHFSRSVILPENLAFNKIRATMENNLLAIAIPKIQLPTKTIKIDKLRAE